MVTNRRPLTTLFLILAIAVAGELLNPAAKGQPANENVPKFELDPYWPKPLPNKWITGQIPGIAVDSHDHIWVIHRPKTIRDQEKGASLHPPTAECCFPAPPVHGIVVSNDGLVYVADRANNRLQVFNLDGTFVKEAFVKRDTLDAEGSVYGFALSPDKEQRFLYSVDGPNMWIRILDRRTLQIVDSVGGHGGHQTGAFYHLHSIAASTDSKGNIYVGEVNEGQRYMRYLYKGMGAPSNPGTASATSGISSAIPAQ